MFTVAEVIPMVVDKLRGRSDLSDYGGAIGSDIPSWLYYAINDLTPNFPFEELVADNAPFFQFQVGLARYPIKYFLAENNTDFSMIRSFFRYFTTINPPVLGNVGGQMKCRLTSVVYPMSTISGIPTYWSQNGSNILFGFCPDQPYVGKMIYQRKHPFIIRDIPNCPVYMPDDWKEVLAYAAAIKGCDFLGMNEIGMIYYKQLHGDPKKPGNIGILAEKASQLQRNLVTNERQLQPIVCQYT